MEAKYYNALEFNKAYSIRNNFEEAKIRYERYLEKYPKDYSAYPYYASTLIKLGYLDEAEKVINFVEKAYILDKRFILEDNKVKCLIMRILYNKIKILSFKGKYDELYNLCLNNLQLIKKIDNNFGKYIILYCKKKLGLLNHVNETNKSYITRQIIEYSESDFKNHIQSHIYQYNENKDNSNSSIFAPNFPIQKIIEELKTYIPANQKIYYRFFENLYIFKYNECGRDKNKLVDYFKVIAFDNTCDFITMCPTDKLGTIPYIDLNYLATEQEYKKIKKLSQIEKFNQKYNHN